jgi:hypothetical protein
MEIKAVVVDELPECCSDCTFEGLEFCQLMFERLDCTRYDTRPNWCPLITERKEVIRVLDKVHG